MNSNTFSTTNYMVPSSGSSHCVQISGVFSAVPFFQDWRQFQIDNFPFQPQGAFIDNTQGTEPLKITIGPIGYTVTCPAGVISQVQFPAPNGQTCNITGAGQASIYFVDFPVLPNSGLVDVGNTVNVNLLSSQSGFNLPVLVPLNSPGGIPYQVNQIPQTPTYIRGTITSATSLTIAAPALQNLRKLRIDLTENATLAAAGITTLTASLNGVVIATKGIYLPANVNGNIGITDVFKCDFDTIAFNSGASGSLVVSLSTALASGQVNVGAYFSL